MVAAITHCSVILTCVCVPPGFTLVVSPLVSLMEDQLMYLKSIDVEAVSLNASSSKVITNKHFRHIIDTWLVLIISFRIVFY